jgi:3,5-epimerase/4-reductase
LWNLFGSGKKFDKNKNYYKIKSMNNVIILGEGFVGKNLSNHFEAKNIPYNIFSKQRFDYTNGREFHNFVENTKSDIKCIINASGCTGYPNVDFCEDNKELCWNLNVGYPLQVLQTCTHFNIPVIHIGSGCIYSGYDKVYDEGDLPNFGANSKVSSYYSKCKDWFEIMSRRHTCHVLRIRIPFSMENVSKNYFSKLLKYDNLINETNSVTSITDFNIFVEKFISKIYEMPYGFYNVVNPQPVRAEEVVNIMKDFGLNNPNWKYIDVKDLNTKANRSNCVLSTEKIKSFGLELPNTIESLKRDIEIFSTNYLTNKEKTL